VDKLTVVEFPMRTSVGCQSYIVVLCSRRRSSSPLVCCRQCVLDLLSQSYGTYTIASCTPQQLPAEKLKLETRPVNCQWTVHTHPHTSKGLLQGHPCPGFDVLPYRSLSSFYSLSRYYVFKNFFLQGIFCCWLPYNETKIKDLSQTFL